MFEQYSSVVAEPGEVSGIEAPHIADVLTFPRPVEARVTVPAPAAAPAKPASGTFVDLRELYFDFLHTCNEKAVTAQLMADRVFALRLPLFLKSFRIFDAGIGDGTILAGAMKAAHERLPHKPLYVVGKEFSFEDVKHALEKKLPERFEEHPQTILTLTNLPFTKAPWLGKDSADTAQTVEWKVIELEGTTAAEFAAHAARVQKELATAWKTKTNGNGKAVPNKHVVAVFYRKDQKAALKKLIPQQGQVIKADFHLNIFSQPFRLAATREFKAKILAPLLRALARRGQLVGVYYEGAGSLFEIVRGVWKDHNPFKDRGRDLFNAAQRENTGPRKLAFAEAPLLRCDLHLLPVSEDSSIAPQHTKAAWRSAVYVAQVCDEKVGAAEQGEQFKAAAAQVVRDHSGALWLGNNVFTVTAGRKPFFHQLRNWLRTQAQPAPAS